MKGVSDDSQAWWDDELEVRDGVGRNETVVGELIERVARRFAQRWYLYCSTGYCQPEHTESGRSRQVRAQ